MSRSLNGSTDQIDCGANVSSPSTALTIASWVNMSSLTPAYSAVYSRFNSGAPNAFHQLFVKSTGHIAYYVAKNGGNNSIDPGSGSISTGSWHHLAFSFDNTNGMKSYLDGSSDGTAASTGNYVTTFGTSHTTIGTDLNTAGRNLGGNIADVALWNVELTASEIAALAKGARPFSIRNTSLLHWMPLDGIQSTEPDFSGRANNGTLTGTALASGPPLMMFTPRWPQNSLPAAAAAPTVFRRTLSQIGTRTGSRQAA